MSRDREKSAILYGKLQTFNSSAMKDVVPTPIKHTDDKYAEENVTLMQWLKTLRVPIPKHLRFNVNYVVEFTNGVLLCDIVSAIDRTTYPGVHRTPKTRAGCISNIRLALTLLEKKPNFPLGLCGCEEEVYQGDPDLIVELMFELMRLSGAIVEVTHLN